MNTTWEYADHSAISDGYAVLYLSLIHICFMAGAKAAKKDKEIMNVRIELSRLALPKEPIMPKEPVIPPEPALRREPEKPDYDIMIGRNDVLDTFRSLMA